MWATSHALRRFPLNIARFVGVEARKTNLFATALIGTSVSKTKRTNPTKELTETEYLLHDPTSGLRAESLSLPEDVEIVPGRGDIQNYRITCCRGRFAPSKTRCGLPSACCSRQAPHNKRMQQTIPSATKLTAGLAPKVQKTKARKGISPQTGEEIKIKAKKVARFVPGKALKDALKWSLRLANLKAGSV